MDGRLLDELTRIVSAAAAAILAARARPLDARAKADHSPVTAADHAAEAVILEGLAPLFPGCRSSRRRPGAAPPALPPDSFVLVDPLDGTREFVAGRDEFTVNVALVQRRAARGSASSARRPGADLARDRGRAPSACGCAGAPASAARERTPSAPGLGRAPARSQRSAARISIAATEASGAAAGRRAPRGGSALKFCQGRRGRRRRLSAAVARPANGTSRPATQWWRPPAAPSPRRRARR